MTKLIVKFDAGGSINSNVGTSAQLGFQQGGAYGMIALGVGGFTNQFPTPNADLNSNNLMAALARDGISNALLSSGNPWAMGAGVAVKVLDKIGGFTDVSEGLGDGNDIGNAIMSFALPGAGLLFNDSSKTDKYKMSADMKVMSRGYAGSVKDARTAESNSGAKLWFGRNKANRMIAEALRKDNIISDIKQDSDADFQTARSMTQNKAISNLYALLGDYNQSYARVGKFGLKLLRAQQLAIKFKEPSEIKEQKEVYVMRDGGEFFNNLKEEFIPTTEELNNAFFSTLLTEDDIQKFQNGGKTYEKGKDPEIEKRLKNLIETVIKPAAEAGNPTARRLMDLDLTEYTFTEDDVNFTNEDGTKNGYDGKPGDTGNVYVSSRGEYLTPSILYRDGKLVFLGRNPKWTKEVIEQSIKFPTAEDAQFFGDNYHDYPHLTPTLAKHLKEGGLMNVIPEGSLHARLHHMENADNLTKKGIPVVDNNGNQLAEIEHSEIIFTKEVTEKLEELYKKFKSDEYTNKEKEGFAIEAGKLLSKEIIENTDDRVGLINTNN